ncbi:MAG TPA: hypothetical protein VFH31_14150 [Pyrinomonadaceae bacterium]|nr:hypothetical protein [Pyrinomonadaceae bacterium]
MFVGHYGVSFAFKSLEKPLPLWLLFIAVQFVDVLWAVFVPMGIEKVRITPGITASNPLDLYYMPYSHSLVAALLWSGAAFIGFKITGRRATFAAFLLAAAVFSHWVLDLIVHRPDLPLYDDTYKMGFGVWNYPALALALEASLLFGGMFLYLRSTHAVSKLGKFGMPVFGIVLLAIQAVIFFGSPPSSPSAAALTAILSYVVFAAVAYWLESKRR